MFRLNLLLRRKNDDLLIFSPAPWFRFLLAALAVVIIIGIITVSGDPESSDDSFREAAGPVIVTVLCVVGMLYQESWGFDRKKRIIVHKYGLIFLYSKKLYSFAEVQSIQLNIFLRGAKSDGEPDHHIEIGGALSHGVTSEVSGRKPKIIHPQYHQLLLELKSGEKIKIENIDSRNTENLAKKSGCRLRFQRDQTA